MTCIAEMGGGEVDRMTVALIGAAFLEVLGVMFVLGRNHLARNIPPRALDGRPATARSVGASGVALMIIGAIVVMAALGFAAAGGK